MSQLDSDTVRRAAKARKLKKWLLKNARRSRGKGGGFKPAKSHKAATVSILALAPKAAAIAFETDKYALRFQRPTLPY